MYTFFEEYDFSGKTIIPFNSHGGSRFSNTISTIADMQPNAIVIESGLTISRNDVVNSREEVIEWAQEMLEQTVK
ncbi:MAG: flavodoxin [Muricoprocola sp.]